MFVTPRKVVLAGMYAGVVAIVAGCAVHSQTCSGGGPGTGLLPTYPWHDVQHARAVFNARAEQVATISAQCDITIRDPRHETLQFDGVLVARPPQALRLRAYKLGRAVLDMTARSDGVWLWITDRAEIDMETFAPSDLPANGAPMTIPLLGTAMVNDPEVQWEGDGGATVRLVQRWGQSPAGKLGRVREKPFSLVGRPTTGGTPLPPIRFGQSLVAELDRATLTFRSFELFSASGGESRRFELDCYALVSGVPLPMRISALRRGGSKFIVRLREVSVNDELPKSAFVPPARASRLDGAPPSYRK